MNNRLKGIKDHQDVAFKYGNTKDNPADLASIGKEFQELKNNTL